MFGTPAKELSAFFPIEKKEPKSDRKEYGLDALEQNPMWQLLLTADDAKLKELGVNGVLALAHDYSKTLVPENNREGIHGGSMDGTEHAKYKDEKGVMWMAKTYPKKRLHRAMVDEFVARLSETMELQTTMHVKTGLIDGGFKVLVKFEDVRGTLWDDLEAAHGDTSKLAERIPKEFMKAIVVEQVLDWLVSNHDPHMGHFLKKTDGGVLCIDKAQAFKYVGEKGESLDTVYNPNAVFNGANNIGYKPAYNVLLPEIAAGHATITLEEAWQSVDAALKKVEAIDDEAYKKALLPYARFRFGVVNSSEDQTRGLNQETFMQLALKRKQEIRAQFEHLYKQIAK